MTHKKIKIIVLIPLILAAIVLLIEIIRSIVLSMYSIHPGSEYRFLVNNIEYKKNISKLFLACEEKSKFFN